MTRTPVRTRVVGRTANIRSNPRQWRYQVFRRTRQAMANRQAFVGGQEIEPSRLPKGLHRGYTYSDIFANRARAMGKTTFGRDTEVPLAVPSGPWRTVLADTWDVHNGLGGVSPDRDILCWRGVHRVTGLKLAVFVCHPVSRGHYTDAQARRKRITRYDWRQARLAEYFSELRTLVSRAIGAGYCVMVLGDMNDPTPPTLHRRQVRRGSGLDHMWLIPSDDYRLQGVRGRTVAKRTRAMDHPILEITGEFVAL